MAEQFAGRSLANHRSAQLIGEEHDGHRNKKPHVLVPDCCSVDSQPGCGPDAQYRVQAAEQPEPARGARVDITDISSLSWSAGDAAVSHDVYLGTDRDAVAGADNNAPEFQGNQAGASLSLAGLVEFGGGDYYWRIDEVEAGGTVHAGSNIHI